MDTVGLILAVVLFIAGTAAILFPVLPGHILIAAGMAVYGLFTGFANLTAGFFVGQAVAVALAFLVDYAANVWGVRRYGGSRAALWGSILGTLVGVFLLGPLGIILGPFLGAFGGELLANGNPGQALRVGLGTLVGFLGSTVLKLAIGAAMIIWFFIVI
ncbi:MAG: DUF456 domain-containing protein [Thermoanaerobacterales bacterium]|nr:DUF456 domain-containing protein [Bacillota bacterium]MDI6906659.1 DUF456 domain-containing protein [Thermoanaerobacterales bacterium]